MIKIPTVVLPSDFVDLLKTNVQKSNDVVSKILEFESLRPGTILKYVNILKLQMDHLDTHTKFKSLEDLEQLKQTIKTIGWQNVKKELALYYIWKATSDQAKFEISKESIRADVTDIVNLENKFRNNVRESNSRIFLLGFYLKMVKAQIYHTETGAAKYEFTISEEFVEFLINNLKGKTNKIDWFALMAWMFFDTIDNNLTKCPYETLYQQLNKQDKTDFINNVINYSCSIDEEMGSKEVMV